MKKVFVFVCVIIAYLSNAKLSNESDTPDKDIPYSQIIHKYCYQYKINTDIIYAIIRTESEFYTNAKRRERHLKKTKWYIDTLKNNKYKNDYLAYYSLGLMQVLYGTAVYQGFTGSPEELMQPENSIHYGVKYYAYQLNRYSNHDQAIIAYNCGKNRKKYQKYLKKVKKMLTNGKL